MDDDEFDDMVANSEEISSIIDNGLPSDGDDDVEVNVEVPQAFPFPFPPYDIQLAFMRKLYETIELKKIGIFESPTGTGKSLSLICGSLLWLKHHEQRNMNELNKLLDKSSDKTKTGTSVKSEASEDWINEFAKKQEEVARAQALLEENESRKKREEKLEKIKSNIKLAKRKRDALNEQFKELFNNSSDLNVVTAPESDEAAEDDDILLTDYVSDDDNDVPSKIKDDSDDGGDDDDDPMKDDHVLKIYYCSRTHSQLSQFIHEVQNSPYADEIRLTTLGSRSNLCINNVVKRLGSLSLINEKCIDMQKNAKTKSSEPSKKRTRQQNSTCPFYKLDGIAELRDRLLVEVKDIEDLVITGKQSKSCPYYASRRAIPSARLVVLPYNTLLHKWTRESSGIVLDNNIVIIDEGHNLIDSISQMHSIELSGLQLCSTHSHLMQYLERYKNKLKAKNVLYIDQLIFIINSFIKVLGGKPPDHKQNPTVPTNIPSSSKIMTLYDFLFHCRLDNMNLFKIRRYCHKSLIAKKLHGFTQRSLSSLNVPESQPREKGATAWALSNFLPEIQQQNALKQKKTIDENYEEIAASTDTECNYKAISPSLNQIVNFLEALTNADKDGRVLITNKGNINQSSIKFLMLNPSIHFKEVVEKARAVIIAGGTMHPISDFKEQLLLSIGVKPNKIVEYTCDHIISRDHLLTITLAHGPSGHHLDFTYNNRGSTDTIKELGRVVYNACYVVPAGVVCFFSSFEYMTQVLDCWRTNGFIEKIEARKMIYKEPKKASEVEKVLEEYSSFINRCQSQPTTARAASFQASNEPMVKDGAIMFCVVGGKMSEGINFSDNMGRCVIMVGLPYPNPNSVELKEKMDYLNSNQNSSKAGKPSGQVYYESICMKAINQSIGRAIRHKNDYACILLLDHRFAAKSVLSKLPAWIQGCVQVHDRFGPALASLKKFFYNKKSEQPDQPQKASIT